MIRYVMVNKNIKSGLIREFLLGRQIISLTVSTWIKIIIVMPVKATITFAIKSYSALLFLFLFGLFFILIFYKNLPVNGEVIR